MHFFNTGGGSHGDDSLEFFLIGFNASPHHNEL